MQVRNFNKDIDYKDVSAWWEKQGWPVLPADVLSSTGFIIEHEGQKMAAAWVYKLQDSPWSLMEWTVGNPDAVWQDRSVALDLLVEKIAAHAKNDNSSLLLTMTKHQRLVDKLKLQQFEETDTDMVHLMRKL